MSDLCREIVVHDIAGIVILALSCFGISIVFGFLRDDHFRHVAEKRRRVAASDENRAQAIRVTHFSDDAGITGIRQCNGFLVERYGWGVLAGLEPFEFTIWAVVGSYRNLPHGTRSTLRRGLNAQSAVEFNVYPHELARRAYSKASEPHHNANVRIRSDTRFFSLYDRDATYQYSSVKVPKIVHLRENTALSVLLMCGLSLAGALAIWLCLLMLCGTLETLRL